MGIETAIGAGISAAASIGGAALSSGGQRAAGEAADEANTQNNVLTAQLVAAGTPYLMGKGDQARSDLIFGRGDIQNALAQGIAATNNSYGYWDNAATAGNDAWNSAYNIGRGDLSNALAEWDSKYNTVRSDNAGYMALGQQGVEGYSGLLKDPTSITSNPGYQFRLNQGSQALDRSAAAKGQLFSGGAQAAQTQYAQDYASNEYDKALARYNTAIGQGQTAQSRVDNAGMTTAAGKSGVYNALAQLATTRAAGLTGVAMQTASGKSGVGATQASLYQNSGNALAGLQTNIANNEQQTGTNVTNYWLKAFGRQQEDNTQAAQQKGQAAAGEANAWSKGLGGIGSAVNSGISNSLYSERTNVLSGQRSQDLNNYWKSFYGG